MRKSYHERKKNKSYDEVLMRLYPLMDISPLLLSNGRSCHSICMVFSDEQIEQFQQIYFKRYGKELSIEIAKEQASKLLQLLILIYKPMSIKEFEVIQKKRLESLPEIIKHITLHDNG